MASPTHEAMIAQGVPLTISYKPPPNTHEWLAASAFLTTEKPKPMLRRRIMASTALKYFFIDNIFINLVINYIP
jgi:hypothetical protein